MKELARIINGRIGELRDNGLFNEEFNALIEMQREVNFIADPNSEKFPTEIITDQNVKKKAVERLIHRVDGDVQKLLNEKGSLIEDIKVGKDVKFALTKTEYELFSAQKFKEFILKNKEFFEQKGSRLWQYEITVDDFAKKLAEKNITIDYLWNEYYARMRMHRGGTSLSNLIQTNQALQRPSQLPGERRAVRTPRVPYSSFLDATKNMPCGTRITPSISKLGQGIRGAVNPAINILGAASIATDYANREFKNFEEAESFINQYDARIRQGKQDMATLNSQRDLVRQLAEYCLKNHPNGSDKFQNCMDFINRKHSEYLNEEFRLKFQQVTDERKRLTQGILREHAESGLFGAGTAFFTSLFNNLFFNNRFINKILPKGENGY